MISALAASPASTQPATGAARDRRELRERVNPALEKALQFLANAQARDGGWHQLLSGGADVGITGLVIKGFIQHPAYGPKHPVVQRAIKYLLKHQQKDGGINTPDSAYANYTTSVALMALSAMKDSELSPNIAAAQDYLRDNQWAEGKRDSDGKPVDTGHAFYGGAGYGSGGKRPDLSNTQMMLEALHASGLPASDPVYKKALRFIERCQMSSQSNDQPFARGTDDGGFIYSPANGGESKAGTIEIGGRKQLRSYGSMTYAGFKSMLYAEVGRDDPRVQQAWAWIRRNYSLESNPNMPGAKSKEGLFYFYHVFAKALEAWGESVLVDERGREHDWRTELVDRLISLQKPDGSWVNSEDRWEEDNPFLVSAYAVLALQTAIE